MKKYNKPIIKEEVIELEDIIANSQNGLMDSPEDSYSPVGPGDQITI